MIPLGSPYSADMDTQVIGLLGRNRLIDEILRAGLEVALPERDRGIDLIAYADLDTKVKSFVACPIQIKAASTRSFEIRKKYAKFPNLILAYVWNLSDSDKTVTYALTYKEAVDIATRMGWTEAPSWRDKGWYSTSTPSVKLCNLLRPYKMTPKKWWKKIVGGL